MLSPRIYGAYLLLLKRNSYLVRSGWLRSFRYWKPMGCTGEILPWMNYPIINLLRQRIRKEHIVFEYGCGYSTLFLASLAKSIVAVEHDIDWYRKLEAIRPDNASILFTASIPKGKYSKAIEATNTTYDIVLVDGIERESCMVAGVKNLSDSGVIILDDSERESYRPVCQKIMSYGFRHIDFEGLKPLSGELSRATIFYRNGNCLGL
jgi:hypothetical protein